MPTRPFLAGLCGRVPTPAPAATRPSRLFDDFCERVLFLAGRRFDASPAIAPFRPPFTLFFVLRPATGLVFRLLVFVAIGFLRWLVVGERGGGQADPTVAYGEVVRWTSCAFSWTLDFSSSECCWTLSCAWSLMSEAACLALSVAVWAVSCATCLPRSIAS